MSIVSADPKGGKGPIESEGFMAFLSNQAATKHKEKKVKKNSKMPKISRNNSVTSDTTESKQEVTTPTTDTPPIVEETEEDPSEPGSKKKRVTWASDSNLTTMHYFEMDESERGGHTHTHTHTHHSYTVQQHLEAC